MKNRRLNYLIATRVLGWKLSEGRYIWYLNHNNLSKVSTSEYYESRFQVLLPPEVKEGAANIFYKGVPDYSGDMMLAIEVLKKASIYSWSIDYSVPSVDEKPFVIASMDNEDGEFFALGKSEAHAICKLLLKWNRFVRKSKYETK